MNNAQLEIYQTIFPWHPPSSENLLQVKPMIANKSYLLNENIPDIKDFEIIPNSFLTLNALRLWKLNKYNLYFNNLKNIIFNQMYLDFGNDILDNRYEMKTIGKLIFKDCSFKDIDIHLCTFIELEFSNCTFDNNVIFRDCMFHKLTFYKCNFSHNVSLQKTHFNGESIFKDSIFKGEINCNTSCFTENAYFNNATFKGYVDFHECEFQKNACFYGATFDKAPNFSQAIFVNNLNFVNVTCNFDFKDIQVSIKEEKDRQQDDKKETPNIANDFRDSFRLIKNALIKENNILDASNFHKYELYCKEIELKENWNKKYMDATNKKEMQINTNRFRDLIDFLLLEFYRKLCEHHTDFLKVFNNLILLIALYALFFYFGGYEIRQNSFSILNTNLSSNIPVLLINFKKYILNLSFIKEHYFFILMSFVILCLLYLMITMYHIFNIIKKDYKTIKNNIDFKSIKIDIIKLFIYLFALLCVLIFLNIYIPKQQASFSVLWNLVIFFSFIIFYLWIIYLNSLFLRYLFIIISYIIVIIAIGINIAILNPFIGKLISDNLCFEDLLFIYITFAYTILMFLILFSLQKTARKNSIIPS